MESPYAHVRKEADKVNKRNEMIAKLAPLFMQYDAAQKVAEFQDPLPKVAAAVAKNKDLRSTLDELLFELNQRSRVRSLKQDRKDHGFLNKDKEDVVRDPTMIDPFRGEGMRELKQTSMDRLASFPGMGSQSPLIELAPIREYDAWREVTDAKDRAEARAPELAAMLKDLVLKALAEGPLPNHPGVGTVAKALPRALRRDF